MNHQRHNRIDQLVGELLDASATYSLREICDRCGTPAEYIMEMVAFGIVEPETGMKPTEWRFSCHALLRARKALRLEHDLSLNLPGIAVSLELLDEVEALRREVTDLRLQLERMNFAGPSAC
jgi:chaperone modulatory protein CbpM